MRMGERPWQAFVAKANLVCFSFTVLSCTSLFIALQPDTWYYLCPRCSGFFAVVFYLLYSASTIPHPICLDFLSLSHDNAPLLILDPQDTKPCYMMVR